MTSGHDTTDTQSPPQSFMEGLALPFLSIRQYPFPFVEWFLTAVVVGSVGVWLVPLLSPDRSNVWYDVLASGSLTSFSIVLLAEVTSWSFPVSTRISGRRADLPRPSASIVGFLLVIYQTALLVRLFGASPKATTSLLYHHVYLLPLTILIASYLVCFRLRDFALTAVDLEERENAKVKALDDKADTLNRTSEGEEL